MTFNETEKSHHQNANSDVSTLYHASSSRAAIETEHNFAAHNYQSVPVVLTHGQGASVWDCEGRHYLDFHSASTAVNHGHCHPKLVAALIEQASRLTLSSRAFHNDVMPQFAEMVTRYFGYEMALPMNTGAEASETAIKIARKWGYKVKGIPLNQAIVLGAAGNHHGRTIATISLASDSQSRDNYGPLVPNISCYIPGSDMQIIYNDKRSLRAAFEAAGFNLAAFLIEPIQGDAGVIVADDDYLEEARALCDEYNVLLICDEIQTGIARTGKLLGHHWSGIRPDLILLGKTMTGGLYPVSCVLGSKDVMLTIEPGSHGSTYGGNPLGAAVAIRALEVVKEEHLVERAEQLGHVLRNGLQAIRDESPIIQTVRGRGLLNAMVIDQSKTNGRSGIDLCTLMMEKGLLLKSSKSGVIRMAPPLVVTEDQIKQALAIIKESIAELPKFSRTENGDSGISEDEGQFRLPN